LAGLLIKAEDRNVSSLVNFGALMEQYKAYDEIIDLGVDDPNMKETIKNVSKGNKVKLYNPEADRNEEPEVISNLSTAELSVQEFSQEWPREEKQRVEALWQEIEKAQGIIEKTEKEIATMEFSNRLFQPKATEPQIIIEQAQRKIEETQKEIEETERSYRVSQPKTAELEKRIERVQKEMARLSHLRDRMPNVFFRLFIWRDMLRGLRQAKPWLWLVGFDFGKPFRSRSIETLYWSTGEWSRDGWITTHNSYFETIYRAGIIGLLFIVILIFVVLFKIVKKLIQFKSVTGVLLSAALINCFIAANFLPILELPYNAIPIWSLFGMTLAYLREKHA